MMYLSDPPDQEADAAALENLVVAWEQEDAARRSIEPATEREPVVSALFPFDPNTASAETLQKLGFSISLSTRIANYRKKGGQFRVKNDLKKIYGMDSTFFVRVYPYIGLPVNETKERFGRFATEGLRENTNKKTKEPFDLNLADTIQLKSINGIGEKLASRIIRYRSRLGGFVHREQVKEVFGLDSTVVRRLLEVSFVDDNFTPNLLNINTLTEQELSSHPYISRTIAKAIVAYRFQHGNFANTDDLRNVRSLKKEDIDRIMPYLQKIEP